MPTGVTVKGFPELRARLSAAATAGPQILGKWQYATVRQAHATAPSRTGRGRASIHASKLTDTRAEVRGAFWLIFMDRGTKAHVIEPQKYSGSSRHYPGGPPLKGWGNPMAISDGKGADGTVFGRKVHRRRMRRRPFLTKAAQDSLRAVGTSEIVKLWNRPADAKRWRKAAL